MIPDMNTLTYTSCLFAMFSASTLSKSWSKLSPPAFKKNGAETTEKGKLFPLLQCCSKRME